MPRRKFTGMKRRRRPALARIRKRPRRSMPTRNARIGGFLGIENKFYDNLLSSSAISAPSDGSAGEHDPGGADGLNTVDQGDGESQRDGRQIVMKKISITGLISCVPQISVTATDTNPVVFIALVLDMQTNGATLNSENVYINPLSTSLGAASPLRNLQFTKRFRVLKTRTLTLDQPTVVWDGTNIEQGGMHKAFQMHVNLNNLVVNFSGTTADIANIVDNSLHIIAYTSSTTCAPTINYNSRLRFQG